MSYEGHSPLNPPPKPLLIVLSGLSGAGKDAVLARLRQSGYPLEFVVTVTTRPPRPNERDGINYHFVSRDRFQGMRERNELMEWAEVYGNWYGVPKKPVQEALARVKDVMVKVDVQGAATIKKILPQAVFIFLTPPSIDELILRLKQRHTESPEELSRRIKTAEEELKQIPLFDYLVFNRQGEVERAATDIEAIITAEKRRVTPRETAL